APYVLPMPPVFRSSEFHPGAARGVLLSTAVRREAAQARSPPCVFLLALYDHARRLRFDHRHAVFATRQCSTYSTSNFWFIDKQICLSALVKKPPPESMRGYLVLQFHLHLVFPFNWLRTSSRISLLLFPAIVAWKLYSMTSRTICFALGSSCMALVIRFINR